MTNSKLINELKMRKKNVCDITASEHTMFIMMRERTQ